MDWDRVIERNREALKRIVAVLFGMAGMTAGADGSLRPGGGEGVLRRARRSAVLRLLRPTESAVRRLVIVAARGLAATQARSQEAVTLPPRPRKPKPDFKAAHAALRRLGIAVVMSSADFARAAAERRAAEKRAAARAARLPTLPLFDPLPRPFRRRVFYVPAHAAPRILSFDGRAPHRLPPPPSADDPVDAAPLARRLVALSRALDDLPGHARRFARWRRRIAASMQNKEARETDMARRSQSPSPLRAGVRGAGASRSRRIWPLKPGLAPGLSRAASRRPRHEIHEVLKDMQYFAWEALKAPDTS